MNKKILLLVAISCISTAHVWSSEGDIKTATAEEQESAQPMPVSIPVINKSNEEIFVSIIPDYVDDASIRDDWFGIYNVTFVANSEYFDGRSDQSKAIQLPTEHDVKIIQYTPKGTEENLIITPLHLTEDHAQSSTLVINNDQSLSIEPLETSSELSED